MVAQRSTAPLSCKRRHRFSRPRGSTAAPCSDVSPNTYGVRPSTFCTDGSSSAKFSAFLGILGRLSKLDDTPRQVYRLPDRPSENVRVIKRKQWKMPFVWASFFLPRTDFAGSHCDQGLHALFAASVFARLRFPDECFRPAVSTGESDREISSF